ISAHLWKAVHIHYLRGSDVGARAIDPTLGGEVSSGRREHVDKTMPLVPDSFRGMNQIDRHNQQRWGRRSAMFIVLPQVSVFPPFNAQVMDEVSIDGQRSLFVVRMAMGT